MKSNLCSYKHLHLHRNIDRNMQKVVMETEKHCCEMTKHNTVMHTTRIHANPNTHTHTHTHVFLFFLKRAGYLKKVCSYFLWSAKPVFQVEPNTVSLCLCLTWTECRETEMQLI